VKKRILLIGYNFSPEPTGIGKYSGEMMYWLAKKGYDCEVITAYPYYPYWKVQEPYTNSRFQYKTEQEVFPSTGKLTVHRCPMYVPAKPSGIKRILLDFSFLISATFKLLQLAFAKKFDVVLVVAPSFQFGLLGALYKKIHKATFVYHVQDMQIEAARDLKMIKSEGVIKFLFKLERYIFKKADVVSTISEGMARKMQEKAEKPILLFPNWSDIELFHPIENKALLKPEFGFKPTDKIILYSGAIGEKQGLEAILEAANQYRNREDLKFIICGSGPYKETLQKIANTLNLENVFFLPLQPFEKFNQFLNMADVHLVIQKANASDLVMPSKLTTILAVGGLALITANEDSGLHTLVKQHGIGLLVDAENQQALNIGIETATTSENGFIMHNARAYAEQYLSIEKVMQSFVEAIRF
jgi:colanic acid biosynthesis glycosyl transferase WcaI